MNKQRRKQLGEAYDLVSRAIDILNSVKDDEQEAHDNLPESIQYGEKGEEMEGYIEMMDESIGYLEDANSVIEQI